LTGALLFSALVRMKRRKTEAAKTSREEQP